MQHDAIDLQWRDEGGKTFLHLAARHLKVEWVRFLLQKHPALADVTTRIDRTPARWTALQ